MNSVPFLSQDGAWVLEIEGGGGRQSERNNHFSLCKYKALCTATEMIPTIEMIPATEMTPNHHRNDPHHRNDTGGHHRNDPRYTLSRMVLTP